MPRPRFSTWIITPPGSEVVIAASGSADILIDLLDTFYPQIMIKQVYAKTAATTGCSCTLYPGFVVDAAGTVEYANNGNSISDMVNPTAAQSSTQISRSAAGLNAEIYSQHVKLHIVNNDATNPVTITIFGDR